jgi:uncharacterized damage-inducible protein DinB
MKISRFLFLTVAVVAMSFNRQETSLTEAERQYAADILMDTRDDLLRKIKGLTEEQINFKADATSWSVAECVEHIAISENNIFGFVQMGLKEPADPAKRVEVKLSDDAVVKMIADRSNKVKTNEAFEPTGKFGSFDGSLSEFKTKRDNNVNYVKTTSDDLRNHYNDFPFGKIDTYQTILFMAAHSRRHTAQIEEILNNPGFPKKEKK